MNRVSILFLALFAAVGCSDEKTNPLAPFSPEIVNEVDAFQFQVTDAENVAETVVYSWENSGTRATIDHSSALTGGSATMTLTDGNGTQVYSSGLLASGNEPSTEGVAGTWTVRVVLQNTSGTLNFRVEKL